jgi:hypothetical protein
MSSSYVLANTLPLVLITPLPGVIHPFSGQVRFHIITSRRGYRMHFSRRLVWNHTMVRAAAHSGESMDELRSVLQDLSSALNESIAVARRAGYLARSGLSGVDAQIEHDLRPTVQAFADADRMAAQPGSVGHLLAVLEADA